PHTHKHSPHPCATTQRLPPVKKRTKGQTVTYAVLPSHYHNVHSTLLMPHLEALFPLLSLSLSLSLSLFPLLSLSLLPLLSLSFSLSLSFPCSLSLSFSFPCSPQSFFFLNF